MSRRLPGQSIRDRKESLMDNRLVPLYLATVGTWLLWLWESHKLAAHQPPQPQAILFLAVALTGVSIIVFRRLYAQFRNLNKGERGELKVAEVLDELRANGYRVIHGIPRAKFNIDHVVVGPSGVYAIETKYRSSGAIDFRNGEGLFVDGYPLTGERDPLKQARGNAAEIHKIIKADCGRHQWVKPLVVFVGDCKVKETWRTTDARVVSESQLLRFFDRQDQPELTRSDIQLIASHLERSAKS